MNQQKVKEMIKEREAIVSRILSPEQMKERERFRITHTKNTPQLKLF